MCLSRKPTGRSRGRPLTSPTCSGQSAPKRRGHSDSACGQSLWQGESFRSSRARMAPAGTESCPADGDPADPCGVVLPRMTPPPTCRSAARRRPRTWKACCSDFLFSGPACFSVADRESEGGFGGIGHLRICVSFLFQSQLRKFGTAGKMMRAPRFF